MCPLNQTSGQGNHLINVAFCHQPDWGDIEVEPSSNMANHTVAQLMTTQGMNATIYKNDERTDDIETTEVECDVDTAEEERYSKCTVTMMRDVDALWEKYLISTGVTDVEVIPVFMNNTTIFIYSLSHCHHYYGDDMGCQTI